MLVFVTSVASAEVYNCKDANGVHFTGRPSSVQLRDIKEAIGQPGTEAFSDRSNNVEDVFQSLARFMILWLIIGFFLFICWISTIVDIVKCEFVTTSNKTVWMLLVLLLPLLGMMLYYIFGFNQKNLYKHNVLLHTRLTSRQSKDKDFAT
jgi:hypothetical protein